MRPLRSFTRSCFAGLAAAAAIVLASCSSEDGLGKRYPVSGTVTYNDQPLEKGAISFVPEDSKGVGASGAIENGAYTLSTGGNDDGARAGKYKVVITAREDTSAKAKADFEKARAARKDVSGTEQLAIVPKQFAAKAAAQAKSLIPPGYGDSRTTTLMAEVKEQSNTIPFKISDADAPPEPKAATTRRGRKGS